MEQILNVLHVMKSYNDLAFAQKDNKPKVILNDISFQVNSGECLGIAGRSGCGKSTLARVIARLIPADSGQIFLCGQNITHAHGSELVKAYEKMQMILQTPEDSFNPRKTLGWSIGEPLRNHKFKKLQIQEKTEELLKIAGLSPAYAGRYPYEVSGGECQRAAIARAIALMPRLLICDEATSALDVTVQQQVIELLSSLCKTQNIACIFITHDLALLTRIADRVLVMNEGKIAEEGTTADIIKNPSSAYTKELLEADVFYESK